MDNAHGVNLKVEREAVEDMERVGDSSARFGDNDGVHKLHCHHEHSGL